MAVLVDSVRPAPAGASRTRIPVRTLAFGLILAQLVLRAVVLVQGNFYWDDLILIGRAGTFPLLSPQLLFYDHDGHLMPGAFELAGLLTRAAPYQWGAAAASLLGLQALAGLAVLRLLRSLLGDRPVLLMPLAFYLFCPLTLPSFAWWAAGLNALPLQIALAWVAADALALCRTGRVRYAISGIAVFALALLFFEKSVLVPVFAAAVVMLGYRIDGAERVLRRTLRAGARLWIGCASVGVVWLLGYLIAVRSPVGSESLWQTPGLLWHATTVGVLPAVVGGPLSWQRWLPSPPWADPPVWLMVLAWLLIVAALVGSIRFRRHAVGVWALVIGWVAVSSAAMVLTRSGPNTTYELAQTLRYHADSAVVIATGIALLVRAPARRPLLVRPAVVFAVTVVFLVASVLSTLSFARSWRTDDTSAYLATGRASLAEHDDVALLDQPVPPRVLLPFVFPNNLISRVFAATPGTTVADSTPELRMLDDAGRVIPAAVAPVRDISAGTTPGCGNRIETVTVLALSGPVINWEWTAQLNYFADSDGEIVVGLTEGRTVRVPVHSGLHQVYVRLSGAGDGIRIQPVSPGLTLCVGAGPVGGVLPAR